MIQAMDPTPELPIPTQSPFKTRPSRWPWFVGGCLGVVFLTLALVILIPAVMFSRWQDAGQRKLDEEVLQLLQSQEPATPQDLETYYSLPEGATDTTQLWSDAAAIFATAEFKQEVADFPLIGLDESEIPPPGQPWPKLSEIRDLLKKYEKPMSQLHQAARAGGAARYETSFEDGIAMTMDNVLNLRVAARMLVLEAHQKLHDGDEAGAYQSFQTCLQLAHSLEPYPVIIAQLVRIAIATMSYDLLAKILPHVELTDDELAKLASELSQDDYNDGCYRAFLGERVSGIQAFENPRILEEDVGSAKWLDWQVKYMKQDRAFYLNQTRRVIETSKAPWPEKWKTLKALEDEQVQLSHDGKLTQIQYLFSLLLLPAQNAVFTAIGRATALRDSAIVAVAVERYRKRTGGNVPVTLNELVPEYLDKIPTDPFEEQPLRYRVEPNRYRVYGIGENRRDDGGETKEVLDIVFSVDRGAPQE